MRTGKIVTSVLLGVIFTVVAANATAFEFPWRTAKGGDNSCQGNDCTTDADCGTGGQCVSVSCEFDKRKGGTTYIEERACVPKAFYDRFGLPESRGDLGGSGTPDNDDRRRGVEGPATIEIDAGSFQSFGREFVPLEGGNAEGLYTDVPVLDGVLAFRAGPSGSVCFAFEGVNDSDTDEFFLIAFELPTVVDAETVYTLRNGLELTVFDLDGDGAAASDVQQTISGKAIGEVVDFIGFRAGVDIELSAPTSEAEGETRFFREGPGDAPRVGDLAELVVFTSLTLSAGDAIAMTGKVVADRGDGLPACSIPFTRDDIFTSSFEAQEGNPVR